MFYSTSGSDLILIGVYRQSVIYIKEYQTNSVFTTVKLIFVMK